MCAHPEEEVEDQHKVLQTPVAHAVERHYDVANSQQ
jgi:hypothetical protein